MEKKSKQITTLLEFNNSELKIVKSALELLVVSFDKELKLNNNKHYLFQQRLAIKLIFKVIDKTEKI
jgi:hypothetical protein